MCLGIPGKVVEISEEGGLKTGKVSYGGTVQKACLEYLPEVGIGQYVVVHAGFAISVVDEEEAMKSHDAWRELSNAAAQEGVDVFGAPLDKRGQ